MLSQRSIKNRFLIQLIVASAALLSLFSSILFFYIQNSIYEERREELTQLAHNISTYQSLLDAKRNDTDILLGVSVELVAYQSNQEPLFTEFMKAKRTYLRLHYPFEFQNKLYLQITRDISPTKKLFKKILNSIFLINAIGFILIIIYAIALSKMLTAPLTTLSRKLSNMNEHMIRPIKTEELPEEFEPLGETINHLIGRIQNFVKYQKELFIGTAHELKTPLAIIKLKNQVTLIKKRDSKEYIDAIKVTNKTVDEMNQLVGHILNIGRQEGAQLENPIDVDIIEFLKGKANDFSLLAESEGKNLEISLAPGEYAATLQTQLLNQVIQNFLQNALKFTPKGKKVILQSYLDDTGLLIEVIDEGCGIDDSVDLFAPFKRQGNKSGAGLGLFLAKSAADAMGADITLRNRDDEYDGTIASLHLYSKLCCNLYGK
ncbi:MAG: HAMP domain-containing sensor histidine kinase [Campylobacterota bacterium]|nr:HAMP domain-containing sensor histidine kinase [Campylobacterota bacterium]